MLRVFCVHTAFHNITFPTCIIHSSKHFQLAIFNYAENLHQRDFGSIRLLVRYHFSKEQYLHTPHQHQHSGDSCVTGSVCWDTLVVGQNLRYTGHHPGRLVHCQHQSGHCCMPFHLHTIDDHNNAFDKTNFTINSKLANLTLHKLKAWSLVLLLTLQITDIGH